MNDPDAPARRAAFAALRHLQALQGEVLPWATIAGGFAHPAGGRTHFASRAIGIFKPDGWAGVLSIRTSIPRGTRPERYSDQGLSVSLDGQPVPYALQATGPHAAANNQHLRQAGIQGYPLIYFRGVSPGHYLPLYPVVIQHCDTQAAYLVAVRLPMVEGPPPAAEAPAGYLPVPEESRDLTLQMKVRLHQHQFRTMVLEAYGNQCILSGLRAVELLAAAHIKPYAEQGPATIQNGLCLSHLHHAAFDANLVGIDPDFRVHVAKRLHAIRDGVILESLQALPQRNITLAALPEAYRPCRDFLAERYERFVQADRGVRPRSTTLS